MQKYTGFSPGVIAGSVDRRERFVGEALVPRADGVP